MSTVRQRPRTRSGKRRRVLEEANKNSDLKERENRRGKKKENQTDRTRQAPVTRKPSSQKKINRGKTIVKKRAIDSFFLSFLPSMPALSIWEAERKEKKEEKTAEERRVGDQT